jgi:hypothetical protein
MPVDVVENKATIDHATHRQKGIAGSAIIHDHTTLLVDLPEIVDSLYPEWGEAQAAEIAAAQGRNRRAAGRAARAKQARPAAGRRFRFFQGADETGA